MKHLQTVARPHNCEERKSDNLVYSIHSLSLTKKWKSNVDIFVLVRLEFLSDLQVAVPVHLP